MMIKDKRIAKEIIDQLLRCSSEINGMILKVKDNCPNEEFEAFRNAGGFVLGYMYTEIIASLYHMHPSLEPEELRDKEEPGKLD